MEWEKLRDEIKEHSIRSKSQSEKYEKTRSWSYAYLTRWIVLEKGLKSLYDNHNKRLIRKGAAEWIDYLDGKILKAPEKIKDFSIQTKIIPSYKFVKDLLGTCNNIKIAIDSNDRYRSKRNRIAHKAEEFRSERHYMEYKEVLDKAIKQLLTKLSQKVNENKKSNE